jgi:glycosyltransferase involved in cell wall biosynthesis
LAAGGLQEDTDNRLLYFLGDSPLPDKIDKDVKVINLQYKGWYTIGSLLMKIRNVIKEYEPDIIHTHLNPAGWYTALIKPKHIPQVHTVHTCYSHDLETGTMRLFFEKLLLLQKKEANLICISAFLKDDLLAAVKMKGRVFVLSNFIDDIYFTENPGTAANDGIFKLVAMGNILPQKNYTYLLDIFRHLKGYPVTVDVYGFGDHEAFSEIATAEGLAVRFMGPAKDPKDIYWRYNGFIMPSKFESFGLAAYEAMASGLPLFLSDIEAFRSLIKDHALYLGLTDAAAAAANIRDAIEAKVDIDRMAKEAKEYAKQYVRRDAYIHGLLGIYHQVLPQNGNN